MSLIAEISVSRILIYPSLSFFAASHSSMRNGKCHANNEVSNIVMIDFDVFWMLFTVRLFAGGSRKVFAEAISLFSKSYLGLTEFC